MIKKLRLKFIIYSMVSIFSLMLVILLVVNITNFSLVGNDADLVTLNITNNNGSFQPNVSTIPGTTTNPGSTAPGTPPGGTNTGPGNTPPGTRSDNPEAEAITRYITVIYNKNTTEYTVNLDRNSTYTNIEDVKEIIDKLKGNVGWYKNYRYRITERSDGTTLYVLLDYRTELIPSQNVLYVSLIVFGSGLILSLAIIIPTSKFFIRPLEKNYHRQKRFITDASHELKTPITIISANNEIEEVEKGPSDATKTIDTQVKRLTSLVKALNDLSVIDEEEKAVGVEFDLSAAISECITPYIKSFEKDKKKLNCNIEEGIIYKGDEKEIRELSIILIDNALKYSTTYANFSLSKEGNRVVIKCENDTNNTYPTRYNGDLQLVFERFYRGDDARGSTISGNGIGLAIAKGIVEKHKGRIYANGKENIFIIKAEL